MSSARCLAINRVRENVRRTQEDRVSQLPLQLGHTDDEAGTPDPSRKLLSFVGILVDFDANCGRFTPTEVSEGATLSWQMHPGEQASQTPLANEDGKEVDKCRLPQDLEDVCAD